VPVLPVVLAAGLLAGPSTSPFDPQALWVAWPAARVVQAPAPCLRHLELVDAIRDLQARHPRRLHVEELGRSVQGRSIHLLTLGRGPRRILLWSQMHGDEPSATPALLDLAGFLLASPDPAATALLDAVTLLLVPMLNPDGAEHYERRNAQAIDINRDALQLSTPEGHLLKEVRDRFEPELGFNLHDQNRRTTVGESGRLATVALLAVAGDPEGTLTAGRARAKRVCSALVRMLERFVPGGISRYDEDWNPRAFGDNLTAWGTPVVLVESGGRPPGWRWEDLTRLNFVALLGVLSRLAVDDLAGVDPGVYEALERNQDGRFVDVLVSGGQVWQPDAGPPYRADVAFDRLDRDPLTAACAPPDRPGPSRVQEVGDGRFLTASRSVDAPGRLIVPALVASARGPSVREWLDDDAAILLARLGVARLRWHVVPAERAGALAVAAALAGPGRTAIEVVDAEEPACPLEINGPPRPAVSPRVDDVLDALTLGEWRARMAGRSLGSALASLTRCPDGPPARPALAPSGPATFLVLRPRGTSPDEAGALSLSAHEERGLDLEAVFIDGREPGTGE